MRMVALKKIYYPKGGGGKDILPGEEFDTLSDRDAHALTKVRLAKTAEQSTYRTASQTAERPKAAPVPVVNVTDDMPNKRVYKRRDMTAEGE